MVRKSGWIMAFALVVPQAGFCADARPQSMNASVSNTALQQKLRAVIGAPEPLEMPGCAAGIFRDGKVLAAAASGAADIEGKRAITLDTQFYAASVSKQFTAMAVVQLVAAGRVGLDDDVRRYVPELPDYGATITVRMLLHHMAGIVDDLNVTVLEGHLDPDRTTRAGTLAILYRQKALRFVPGTRFEYSNGGYMLLSEIVERVSGEPFERYVGAHILKPLGMQRSFMMRDVRGADADRARGYGRREGKPVLSDRYPPFGGSGGLVTTLADLARWDSDLDSGHKVWTPAITRMMLESGTFANGAPIMRRGHSISYAGGLAIGPHWVQHTGSANGFVSIYARHPASRTGIALLCNDGTIDVTASADAIASTTGGELPPIGEIAVNPHALDGDYRNESLAAAWHVETVGNALMLAIRSPETPEVPARLTLTRTPEGEYRFTGLSLSPDDDNDGFVVTFGLVSYRFARVRQPVSVP
jgi:CubicO group peptidase (beta-lactamase class C family)